MASLLLAVLHPWSSWTGAPSGVVTFLANATVVPPSPQQAWQALQELLFSEPAAGRVLDCMQPRAARLLQLSEATWVPSKPSQPLLVLSRASVGRQRCVRVWVHARACVCVCVRLSQPAYFAVVDGMLCESEPGNDNGKMGTLGWPWGPGQGHEGSWCMRLGLSVPLLCLHAHVQMSRHTWVHQTHAHTYL